MMTTRSTLVKPLGVGSPYHESNKPLVPNSRAVRSVLCGFAKEGRFPVGLQLIGRDLDEALLYRVAYSYEQATEWHLRHPSL